MIRSMTGFGTADAAVRGKKIRIEVNSVNNRFLETSIRVPKMFADYEGRIREAVGEMLARGKIFIVVSQTNATVSPEEIELNESVAANYYRIFPELKKRYRLGGEIELRLCAGLPDLFTVAATETASEAEVDKLIAAIRRALRKLNVMRQSEGKALAADMQMRLKRIEEAVAAIAQFQPQSLERYRQRLANRVKEVLGASDDSKDVTRDARLRLDMEVALMADKADVTEECVRLRSHCKAFAKELKSRADVGKKLNFILQEMNREANTIGSKSILYAISAEVISIKEEVEKLREQVQNVE
jgi:uncharacterized protein (TIGR00255 family)